jgi:hypothetical protein
MNTLPEVLTYITARGMRLVRRDGPDSLIIAGAGETLREPAFRAVIAEHKPALLAYLASIEEPIYIDLETRSAASIKDPAAYARHPSTEILSVVAIFDGQATVWSPVYPVATDLA